MHKFFQYLKKSDFFFDLSLFVIAIVLDVVVVLAVLAVTGKLLFPGTT